MFNELIEWSDKNYSHLPWRNNRNLYTTLVSEIMLQQTTVSTVLNHFERFIFKYPNILILAKATEEDMLIDWKGLGYYRRARNLLNAAKEIKEKFGGKIPLDFDQLTSIKGIGEYTANAIISIGANQRAIALDANLERVLARYYGIEVVKGPKLLKEIYSLFSEKQICLEIDDIGARAFNEALMDLGRSICKARRADCLLCPLKGTCKARINGKQEFIPVVLEKQKKIESFELHLLRVIVKKDERILAYKKDSNEWLSGQYEIPTFILSSDDIGLKQYPWIKNKDELFFLPSFKTGITKYKINNYVLIASELELKKISDKSYEWVDVGNKNFSTSTFKSLAI